MVVGGLVTVGIGIAFAAWLSMRFALRGRLTTGLAAIGPAALAGFTAALLLDGPTAALTVPTTATLAGFALAFGSGGDDDRRDEPDDDPPWWPSFERGLRQYERARSPAGRR